MLLGLLISALVADCNNPTSSGSTNPVKKGALFDDFEEAGSFYDRYGNEHIVDDDDYCLDCDDYHF